MKIITGYLTVFVCATLAGTGAQVQMPGAADIRETAIAQSQQSHLHPDKTSRWGAEPGVGVRVMTVLGSLESHKPVTEMLDTRNVPDTPILSRSQSPDSHCECVAWHGQGSTYLKWLCLGFSLEQGLALVTGGIPGCEMNMTSLFPPHSWPLIGHTELPEPSYLLTM